MFEGLTSSQADARLAAEGPNALPRSGRRSILKIVGGIVGEPMFGLLIAGGAIYFLIGDTGEAALLCGLALLSVLIAGVQEWRSERVLEALRNLTSPRALVIRDGVPQRIAGTDVVREDLLLLAEGDRVPADAELDETARLHADESLLTGESVPVEKAPGEKVFSGSLVVRGGGRARVVATGPRSEIGRIGVSLASIVTEQPRLQTQTRTVVRLFAVLALSFSLLNVVLYGVLRGAWTEGLLGGIALGMSLLPEEFPLILTVFMVMGAWRISRLKVLTRRAPAIETLGSTTVLCTDKTGTLTLNRMTLVHLEPENGSSVESLLRAGVAASDPDSHDPMDAAFRAHPLAPPQGKPATARYALAPDLPMTAAVFGPQGAQPVFAKGAPETIAQACGLDEKARAAMHARIEALAADGLRILALAEAVFTGTEEERPARADGFTYRFLGLAGFEDPLRPDVPDAVRACREAGIRIVLISGDHPRTVQAIARKAGIDAGETPPVVGEALARMDDRGLARSVTTTALFARIRPEQKLRIVEALKARGEIVAMTGDGVNDAPSLKAAHIGVAMGGRGTDVAREAAAIVLLDDSFAALVATVGAGRRIYDNIRKAMLYVAAIHVPIAGLAMLPLLTGTPLILTPLLIALLEMVIDPVCSIALEAEPAERDAMKRPPRDPAVPLLPRPLLAWGAVQGVLALCPVVGIWLYATVRGLPEDDVRAAVFIALLAVNLVLILVNRSFSPSLRRAVAGRNPALTPMLAGAALGFTGLMLWPPARTLFGLGQIGAVDCGLAAGAGLVLLPVLEALKARMRARFSSLH